MSEWRGRQDAGSGPQWQRSADRGVRLLHQPSGEHARRFLGGFQGALMVDDYAGYKALFAQGVTELGCWAHARRKFFDLHAARGSPIAREAMAHIAGLYRVEAKAQAQGMTSEARHAHRQRHAVPCRSCRR